MEEALPEEKGSRLIDLLQRMADRIDGSFVTVHSDQIRFRPISE
jgi:hypothetical protein